MKGESAAARRSQKRQAPENKVRERCTQTSFVRSRPSPCCFCGRRANKAALMVQAGKEVFIRSVRPLFPAVTSLTSSAPFLPRRPLSLGVCYYCSMRWVAGLRPVLLCPRLKCDTEFDENTLVVRYDTHHATTRGTLFTAAVAAWGCQPRYGA